MKKMLVLAVALAMAMQAVAINSLLDQWLSFVDQWGILYLWQNILYYTFTIALPIVLCDLELYDIAGFLNEQSGLVTTATYDAWSGDKAALCREGFDTYYDAQWYADESPVQSNWDRYNYTPV